MRAPIFGVSPFICENLIPLPQMDKGYRFHESKFRIIQFMVIMMAKAFCSLANAKRDTSAVLQLSNKVGNISRLGASPGFCDGTVASAKTANPEIKTQGSTSVRLSRRGTIGFLAVFCLLSCNGQLVRGQKSEFAQTETTHKLPGPIVVPECRIHIVNEVSLSCERSGILDFVVSQGGFVKQGEVIVRLRDSIARAAYSIAEHESANDIEIRFARKAGELAQLKYERAQQADQALSGTVTEFELRELRLAAERSLLQHQQAEHQFAISLLKKQEQLEILKSYQLTAPFDAFVRVAHKKPGEYVREGEVVLEIVNDGIIRVDGYIDLDDLPYVAPGNKVLINLPQSGGEPVTFRGKINFVDTKIEPVSMKARVSAEVRNSNSLLKDGLLVTMAIAATTKSPKSYK